MLVYPFVVPWSEPFNLTAVESMMTGTPVMMMANGSANELIGDDINMQTFKPSYEYSEYFERIKTMVNWLTDDNIKYVSQLVHNNAMRFTIDKMVERYENYLIDK